MKFFKNFFFVGFDLFCPLFSRFIRQILHSSGIFLIFLSAFLQKIPEDAPGVRPLKWSLSGLSLAGEDGEPGEIVLRVHMIPGDLTWDTAAGVASGQQKQGDEQQ